MGQSKYDEYAENIRKAVSKGDVAEGEAMNYFIRLAEQDAKRNALLYLNANPLALSPAPGE